MSTPKTKNVTGFDTRPFHLGNHDGLSNLGMSNAPNSNIKSQLKVPIATYDNRKMLFSSGYGWNGSDVKEFRKSCESKKSMEFLANPMG